MTITATKTTARTPGGRPWRARLALLVAACLLAPCVGSAWAQTYSPGGKRDPFRDLSKEQKKEAPKVVEPPPFSQRPPGLAGLLISEVAVVGTAANDNQRIVILRGADEFTYVAREGAKLFDGYIETIETDQVVFVREVFDTAGRKTTSTVMKRSS